MYCQVLKNNPHTFTWEVVPLLCSIALFRLTRDCSLGVWIWYCLMIIVRTAVGCILWVNRLVVRKTDLRPNILYIHLRVSPRRKCRRVQWRRSWRPSVTASHWQKGGDRRWRKYEELELEKEVVELEERKRELLTEPGEKTARKGRRGRLHERHLEFRWGPQKEYQSCKRRSGGSDCTG